MSGIDDHPSDGPHSVEAHPAPQEIGTMEPTHDTVPARSSADERSREPVEQPATRSRDIIQPSSVARVTWRPDDEQPGGERPR